MTPPRHIYFIRRSDGEGPIKIGCAFDPAARLKAFGGWSPCRLKIIFTMPGDMQTWFSIQDCLEEHHSHFEWFHPHPEVTGLLEKLQRGVAIADAIDTLASPVRIAS